MTREEWLAILERDRTGIAMRDRRALIATVRELVRALRPFGTYATENLETFEWNPIAIADVVLPFEDEPSTSTEEPGA